MVKSLSRAQYPCIPLPESSLITGGNKVFSTKSSKAFSASSFVAYPLPDSALSSPTSKSTNKDFLYEACLANLL